MTQDRPLTFDDFVVEEFEAVVALALALLGSRDDALDVAQETMARVQQHWGDVSALDRPGAWSRRVALNLVTDTLRRRTRHRRLRDRLRDQRPTPADGLTVEQWDRRLWDRVAALPTRQRDVVVLHYVHDLPVSEIAEIVGAPAGTVKSDLSRARDQLRVHLEAGPP